MPRIGVGINIGKYLGASTPIIPPPLAPSGLTLTILSSSSIRLDWTNNSLTEDGFVVERKGYDSDWSVDTTLGSGVVTHTDTLLTDNYYSYRVRAFKDGVYSEYCDAQINTTPLCLYDGSTVAWFDASDLTTITKDVSNLVGRWNDKLGSGHDLIQANDTNKPLWVSPGYILADGADNFLKTGSFTLNQPESIYAVIKQVTWTVNDRIWDGNTSTSGQLNQASSSPRVRVSAGSNSAEATDFALDTWSIVRVIFNGASSKLQINYKTAVTGNFGAANMSGFTLFKIGASANYANAAAKEIIIRNVADSVQDYDDIATYLENRNGVITSTGQFDKGKVVFTYDDGYKADYNYAFPIFQAEGIKGTFYIVTDWVGTEGFLTWADIQAMNTAGMDIQCHTKSHPELTSLTKVQIEAELDGVTTAFAANSITAPVHHAYPFGHYDANVIDAVDGKRTTGRVATAGYVFTDSDKYTLKSVPFDITTYQSYVAEAKAQKKAVVFYTHNPSVGLQEAIDHVQAQGLDILSMKQLVALMV